MFTKITRNKEKLFISILGFCFVAAFSVLLYVDKTSAQSLPLPPINENEVEDINLFAGTSIGGQSSILLYIDFSQSMGTNQAGVQTANWDQSYPIVIETKGSCDGIETGSGNKADLVCVAGTCVLGQKIEDADENPEGFAIAHCAANATGITTELVDKDGGVIHNAYDTITITTDSPITINTIRPDPTIMRTTTNIVRSNFNGVSFEGVFGGCGARACTRSKFGTCENSDDFVRFLRCIDTAYSDVLCPTCPTTADHTVVKSVFSNALDVNCGVDTTVVSSILSLGTGDTSIVDSLKTGLRNECTTDREKIWAAAAMDNYANFLNAEVIQSVGLVTDADDLKTCGAQHCITVRGTGGAEAGSPNETNKNSDVALDQSCNNGTNLGPDSFGVGQITDELDRFAACMEATGQKQPFVKACTTGGADGPFCSPGQNGSTRSDAMLTVVAQILDRDSSLKTTLCSDTDKLFNGVDSQISCFNYMNTPFRDLGSIPDVTGGDDIPVLTGGESIESFFTTADEALAPFRLGSANFSGITPGISKGCAASVYNSDQGGLAGNSNQKFRNTLGEFTKRVPEGRTALANAIGFDDRDASNSYISDDIIGIYRVALNSDNSAACRAHFAIMITDGEDNCSGHCTEGTPSAAFGAELDFCNDELPPATGNSNRRSTLAAASYSRTHFARWALSDKLPEDAPDKFIDTEILTFYIGWGVKDNPLAVRTLNAAALLGGTHTSGLLLHRSPQGSLVGQKDLDGSPGVPALFSTADIDEIRSNFPWLIEMAEMETDNGSFDAEPDVVTLQDCANIAGESNNISESGSCTWNGTDVFDNDFFDGTAGTDFPTVFTKTDVGESFAFFVDNPAELVAALEAIFDFTRGFTAVGQAPTVPPSVTAIGLRDRVLLPSFTPVIGEPIWQGRLALFGFLDDPDNPGGKIIVRKPRSDTEFLDGDDLDGDAINSANIFTDTGSLNSNAEEFFWDAGKILAERDIVNSPRNLLTVDSTVFGTQIIDKANFDAIIYTTGLVAFDKSLDPEVFGISDTDVDPGSAGSIIPICTDVCPDGPLEICDSSVPLTADCKTCVKEDCLRDKIVDFMSGKTGLLPLLDNFGEPTLDSCTDDINDNTTRGVIGCGCPDIEVTNTNIVTDSSLIASLANCERRLGDIFHSQAKIVQAPTLLFFDTGFVNFAQTFRDRSAVIYAGANDGFLHAFHGGDFVDVINDTTLSAADKKSPFTGLTETLPFVDEGTGNELFGYAPPTFLMDALAPDGTLDSEIDPNNPLLTIDTTRRIFTGVEENYDPTSPIQFQDFTIIDSGKEPLPDFRFGDFKTLVEKNLALGHLGSNVVEDVNNFQRSFFDGTPFIIDIFLDGKSDQTNGIPYCNDPAEIPDPYDSGSHPDGEIDACGREWHTVLVSGFRNGGGGLTALDITNMKCANDACTSTTKNFADGPDYPEHLWTVFDRQMGNTWSQPKVGRVRIKYDSDTDHPDGFITDRWVLFAGGGFEPVFTNPIGDDDHRDTAANEFNNGVLNYDEDIYRGNAFYAIDVATGKIIFKFDKNDDSNFVCDVPADPNVIDINSDGYVDLVYIGDKCGRMWRFDISEPIEAGITIAADNEGIGSTKYNFSAPDWSGSPVFCANDPDAVDGGGDPDNTCLDAGGALRNPVSSDTLFPIFFAPTTVIDNLGRTHVIFQTGDRAWPSNEDKFGYLYNFIDEYIPSFQRGSETAAINTFKTVFDIDEISEDGSTLSIIANGAGDEFTIENTSSDATDPSDPAQGQFVVKFANGCNTTLDACEGGEKGIGTPIVFSGVLLFTTFTPQTGEIDVCSAGLGSGRVFAIDFITGLASLFRVPGAQVEAGIAGIKGGEGMVTPPQISYTSTGEVTMTLAFSGSGVAGGAQFLIWEFLELPASTQTLYWEEVI